MALQTLTPPQDITWTRMAYSRDMIDTNFGDLALLPKWRSSLAVYYYIVPEEETADAYPDSKIVYLKFTCSITGYNPSEELLGARKEAEASGALDDLQKSIWETISSKGWASVYYPCLGAIMQLAVYPGKNEQVGPDDFPIIMDFEPKKRELYEAVTEGNEILSGTSDKTNVTKGSTNVESSEWGASAGGKLFGIGASADYSRSSSDTTINQNTTDTSREARETLSRTTSFSQMYQLFNGYHLGTNRALFVVAPRPHTVSGSQTEFVLIDNSGGGRKLEGIQEMFIVVQVPSKLKGFCIQANLDTGHTVQRNSTKAMSMRKKDDDFPDPDEDLPDPDEDLPGENPPQPESVQQLIVTRRTIQNCGQFDENGNFVLIGGGPERPVFEPLVVVWEDLVAEAYTEKHQKRISHLLNHSSKDERIKLANETNLIQNRIIKSMISGISSGTYKPKSFTQTKTFLRLSGFSLYNQQLSLTKLKALGYIDEKMEKLLSRKKITTVADLFNITDSQLADKDLKTIRANILRKALLQK